MEYSKLNIWTIYVSSFVGLFLKIILTKRNFSAIAWLQNVMEGRVGCNAEYSLVVSLGCFGAYLFIPFYSTFFP
jgi:hypothetical protein